MDDSSVGKKKDYKAFQRVLYNLDMALKTIVNGKQAVVCVCVCVIVIEAKGLS